MQYQYQYVAWRDFDAEKQLNHWGSQGYKLVGIVQAGEDDQNIIPTALILMRETGLSEPAQALLEKLTSISEGLNAIADQVEQSMNGLYTDSDEELRIMLKRSADPETDSK